MKFVQIEELFFVSVEAMNKIFEFMKNFNCNWQEYLRLDRKKRNRAVL